MFRVVKTINYDNCKLRSAFNFGFNQVSASWKPGTNGKENSPVVSNNNKHFV